MRRGGFLLLLAVLGSPEPPGLVSQGLPWGRVALSPSPMTNLMFKQGNVYVDGQGRRATNVPDLIKLYQAHGATEVYARIATSQKYPGGSDHTLATGLALAKAAVAAGGLHFDQLGLSVYVTSGPEADARWQGAQRTIVALGQEFGRPIFLAEVAYPSGRIWLGPFFNWDHPVNGYPPNEQGQAKFLCQMVSWGAANGVIGIRPWAPEFLELGWSPMVLFRRSGAVLAAKPALDALSPNCLKSLGKNGLVPETSAQPNHFFPGETDKQSVSFPGRD